MKTLVPYGLLLSCLFWLNASTALADEDLFAGTPSPTPAFLSDHSFDNEDVDGTSKKFKKAPENSDADFLSKDDSTDKKDSDDDIDAQPTKTTKQDEALSALKKAKDDDEKDDGL